MHLHFFVLYGLLRASACAPNFLFVLTDDQDLLLDGLSPMQKTLQLVANEGATFANAFVNSPICCPSRSTILTGKYPHNIHVTNNSISGNCSSYEWQEHHEPFTVTAILKRADYRTFYAGKYLNQYGARATRGTEHIPVGYDWWVGLEGNSKYYNYTISVNGTAVKHTDAYFTDVIKRYALDFLGMQTAFLSPFFMIVAPPAAHAPFTPAPRHRSAFPEARAVRTPSFNYTPHDKHWVVAMKPTHLPRDVSVLDDIQRRRMQTLLAVDEMVEALVLRLCEIGVLDDTYVIFTSDNGFHIGQFTQPWDKRQPYETDIRVPLLIRGPKVPKKTVINHPVSAVDLTPTILNLAGVKIPDFMDGNSFKTVLERPESSSVVEGRVLVEYYGEGNSNTVDEKCAFGQDPNLAECNVKSWCKCQDAVNNTYSCVVHFKANERIKFCVFYDSSDFIEAYDLVADPHELNNMYKYLSKQEISFYRDMLH